MLAPDFLSPRCAVTVGDCSVLISLSEISLEQTRKRLAVAGLVTNVTEKPSNINTFFKNPTWLDTIFVL